MNASISEMYAGGGTHLYALCEGLRRAGIKVTVSSLIEMETQYLAYSAANHPESSTFTGSSSKYHPSELSVPVIQKGIRIFSAGIPCTGSSKAGRSKNRLKNAEEHKDVGHLFLPTLHYIRLHKPDIVVLENTDAYRNTLSASIIRRTLAETGYTLDERIVNPLKEFAAPCQRKRWVLIASRIGAFQWLYETKPFTGTLAPYLDAPSPLDEEESATPKQVLADSTYCNRKASEGCGFAMSLIDHNSTKCPTIPKSYGKRQPTGTFVRTATSYRMLRPREIARLHGLPDLFKDAPKTLAYEMYGQGVDGHVFEPLGYALGQFLLGNEVAIPSLIESQGQLLLFG